MNMTAVPKPEDIQAESTISKEFAEQEFNRWVVNMDLDLDMSDMDQEDVAGFEKQKRRIIREIMRGKLIFNDEGLAVYTPSHKNSKYKNPLTFHERTGASLMAMDGKKDTHNVKKMYAMLADMCKVHSGVFAGLAGTDVKVCEAIFTLLMD